MKAAVVDPGGDLDRIEAVLRQVDVSLEKILVTHAHFDHAGGVAELAEKYSVPIEGPHIGDKFWIDSMPEMAKMFGIRGGRSFVPDRWLDDGDTVTVGDTVLEVLHCPGHTPGHVVFFSRADNLAMVGDVLFEGSIGRTDLPQGDHAQLVNAIRSKLWPLGDDVAFIPGHGPMSTFGRERQTNPFVADSAR